MEEEDNQRSKALVQRHKVRVRQLKEIIDLLEDLVEVEHYEERLTDIHDYITLLHRIIRYGGI